MSTLPANYTPVRRLVENVTNDRQALVTTKEDHEYETGQWIRLIVPKSYGMDVNYFPSPIEVISSTEFEMQLDTRPLLPFVSPSVPPAFTDAQVVPITGITDNVGIV